MHKGRTWIEERKQRYRLFLDSVIYNNHWEISGKIHIHRIFSISSLRFICFADLEVYLCSIFDGHTFYFPHRNNGKDL